ncbi:MAG TPA: hypothetical protein VHN98_02155 [Acidimicrobiales bacterium]|nr:hypothetical protein [Acidimicrobiales bacterium]
MTPLADPGAVAEANRLVTYHGAISKVMTAERTSLESGLIPVTAYILVSGAECFFRHPEMAVAIDAAMPAEEIGRAGRYPGSRVNAVHLWSIANIYLTGRKVLGMMMPERDDPARTASLLQFWERAALAYRGDGHAQAWDAGLELHPYDDGVVATLLDAVVAVESAADRAALKRFNATVMNYLFLLYFDTRVGTGDSGPYRLPDGRVLLVRDFYRLGPSDFWWSDVAEGMPYGNLTAAMVLDGVDLRVNDWGTSLTTPEDYLDHLVGFGLFTTDPGDPVSRTLRPVDLSETDAIVAAVRAAQSTLYRRIAAMDRDEKIRCGAYVYFSFLRPFAEVAGIAGELDWTVPRDSVGPIYDMLRGIDGTNTGGALGEEPYYLPYA